MADYIEQYVRDAGSCGLKCRKEIINYFETHPVFISKPITVFRGQTVNDRIDPKTSNTFFSVSLNKEIAEDFANGGYLFAIHLNPGVQYINVGEILSESSIYDFEDEYLVRGGGIYREISRKEEPKFVLIEVEYSNIVGGAGVHTINIKKKNNNTNKRNKRNKRTRKISKKNLTQRALNEGLPNNMINNNILKMYLNPNEVMENV